MRFSIPAGLALAAVALPVYWAYLLRTGDVPTARSALATIGIYCGILLIAFLSPPGPPPARALRPTLLAGAMVAAFCGILVVPPLRELFELAELPLPDVLGLAGLAIAWAVVLFRLRAVRVVARILRAARPLIPAEKGH